MRAQREEKIMSKVTAVLAGGRWLFDIIDFDWTQDKSVAVFRLRWSDGSIREYELRAEAIQGLQRGQS